MGYADRDYIRETSTRPPSRLAGAPVVKWLLFLNLGIFLIDIIFEVGMKSWGAFTVPGVFENWQVWRVITFQFLHADFGHLIFNSIAIYFFGAFVEEQLKSRAFLVFYLLCGIAGAMTYTALVLIGYQSSSVVGASAGIFGILVVAAMIAPNMQVRLLLPPVTLTMKQLALILLFIGAFVVVTGGRNAGGQAGHLGGALAGFLIYRIPLLRALLEMRVRSTSKQRSRHGAQSKRAKNQRYEKKLRPKSTISKAEASEVDRILDKINEHGLQSLTEEERLLLTRAGKK